MTVRIYVISHINLLFFVGVLFCIYIMMNIYIDFKVVHMKKRESPFRENKGKSEMHGEMHESLLNGLKKSAKTVDNDIK